MSRQEEERGWSGTSADGAHTGAGGMFAAPVADVEPSPETVYLSDEDYEAAIGDTLAEAQPSDLWIFAYCALLWAPAFEVIENRPARLVPLLLLQGSTVPKTSDRSGLRMALDRGGRFHGIILIVRPFASGGLDTLIRCKIVVKPA
jgi:glutathione-specific gamma-glutamylcyclotransferase